MSIAILNTASFGGDSGEYKGARVSLICSESPTTRSSPSARRRRRRSVSSMRRLMPLALSTSPLDSHSSTQPTMQDGVVEDRVDDYLPELLARDLQLSAAVFAAKNMTAGAPAIRISFHEESRARVSRVPLQTSTQVASANMKSRAASEEQDSMVSSFDPVDPNLHDYVSDISSTSSRFSGEEAEPPSFRHRASLETTATSTASIGCKHKPSCRPEYACRYTWLDLDSDRDEHETGHGEGGNVSFISPRPPTRQGSGPGLHLSEKPIRESSERCSSMPSAPLQKLHSVSEPSPRMVTRRQQTGTLTDPPLNSCTAVGPRNRAMSRLWKSPSAQKVGQFSRDSSIQPRRTQSLCVNTIRSSSPNSQLRNRVLRLSAVRKSLPLSEEDFLDKDDEAIYSSEEQSDDRSKPGIARHSTSTESLPSVQSWLESSLRPYPRACRNEECAKPVPLPSDAVETLRVSVACFPETMLLTSSLTVETIRSYARKVRQPSMNRGSIEPSESPAREARKSLWRKAATYKCGSETGHSKSSSREATTRPWDGSCEDSDRPKPWAPIKNVFGCCSDYLSDALYAHIVAYNYVSALTVGDPSPHASRVRRNNATTACGRGSQQQQQQQHLDVPEKAARLLGLLAEPDMAAGTNRLSKRPGSPRADWHGPDMPTSCEGGPSAQDNNDTLRAIQSGLLRCVSRLVATAKLTAGMGAGQDGMADTEAEEGADMLLMRSLCEIVRIAEESS